jgi:rRNA processing protein Krr1/Pno1
MLESRVVGEGGRARPAGRLRIGVAIALAVGMVSALGAFGGLSYAATGVTHAVQAATHVVAPSHQAQTAVPLSSARAQYLVALCFHRHTIYIDSHAAPVLRRLGAREGPCNGGRRIPPARTTVVCVKGHNVRVTLSAAKALVNAKQAKHGFCKKT